MGTLTNHDFYRQFLKLWELILIENFYSRRTHVKMGFKF
ncbi:hypothetical protein LEP1GSC059_1460 [Leptospira noguchii serovar Panama str. CZ214]|uniref:Uncharacterized protein n=1 Tax=Leptospira noguchii serovar Panama str. CZ214 TaxID=1001595 RepID=T0H0Q1_9LEPT|nr:hypothetical protein LEP1GSC059_1460 [Leptospira noguchii serovar Panama str. CZ214]